MSQSVEDRCLELELAVGLLCQVLRAHVTHHAPADGEASISVLNMKSLLEAVESIIDRKMDHGRLAAIVARVHDERVLWLPHWAEP